MIPRRLIAVLAANGALILFVVIALFAKVPEKGGAKATGEVLFPKLGRGLRSGVYVVSVDPDYVLQYELVRIESGEVTSLGKGVIGSKEGRPGPVLACHFADDGDQAEILILWEPRQLYRADLSDATAVMLVPGFSTGDLARKPVPLVIFYSHVLSDIQLPLLEWAADWTIEDLVEFSRDKDMDSIAVSMSVKSD